MHGILIGLTIGLAYLVLRTAPLWTEAIAGAAHACWHRARHGRWPPTDAEVFTQIGEDFAAGLAAGLRSD